jgi:hypothetical protein
MNATQPPDPGIEGLDDGADEPFEGYPIDSLQIRQETRTIFDVVGRIQKGGYVMDPEFQRDFVWSLEMQSRLIESVLMRIPLPVFYLAENREGKLVVVDGLQRLTTFKRFLDGQFALELDNEELNGKTFQSLPAKLQNRIEDAPLILYILDYKVPERAKLDIFERVNSGQPITRQQMRNCLYVGPATRWLREETRTELFQEATGHSLNTRTMRDREVANRFCSFALLGYQKHKGDMDSFLAEGLDFMNGMDERELEELRQRFRRGLENNVHLFGKHAFRKHERGRQARNPFNVALFDVFSVLLADVSPERVAAHAADAFREGFFSLMNDAEFFQAISQATSTPANIRTRFEKAKQMLAGVLDADSH